jgi:hypothetical protein
MNLGDDFREWHYLRPNKWTTVPGRIIVVDVCADRALNATLANTYMETLKCGHATVFRLEKGAATRASDFDFNTGPQLWTWIVRNLDQHRITWLFGHQLSRILTLTGFWQEVESGRFQLQQEAKQNRATGSTGAESARPWKGFICLDDPPVIIKVRHGPLTLQCVDTLNYWRASMDALAELGGGDKRPPLPVTASEREALWWCREGCGIVSRAVLALCQAVRAHGLGNFAATAPAQAWSAYRHRFMTSPILIHGSKSVIDLERAALYPGRWELFYAGRVARTLCPGDDVTRTRDVRRPAQIAGPIYNLDCSSFYPSLMRDNDYPYKLVRYEVSPSVSDVRALSATLACVARVKVCSPVHAYPVRAGGRTLYATGTFITTLCGAELEYALWAGHIIWVGEAAFYERGPILREYATYMIDARRDCKRAGDAIGAEMFKLLGNSLFGKFSQRHPRWEDNDEIPPEKRWGTWVAYWPEEGRSVQCRALNCKVQAQKPRYDPEPLPQLDSVKDALRVAAAPDEAQHSSPIISAYVTAYGRCRMDHYRRVAGVKNVLYQHTDSLIVNSEGYDRLSAAGEIREGEAGCLSERGRAESGMFWAQNDYLFGDKRVCGSIALTAVEAGLGEFVQEEYARGGRLLDDAPRAAVPVRVVVRYLAREHPPGALGPDGFYEPVVLPPP